MLYDGVILLEGSSITNPVVAKGAEFPASPDEGELFYATGVGGPAEGLYVYNGASWSAIGTATDGDGNVVFSSRTRRTVATGVSAAGTTQGTATLLSAEINGVATVAAGTGVRLPSSIGTTFIVVNQGANALNVYPASGAAIDGLAANVAQSLPVGSRIMFVQLSATQYYTLNATYA